MASTTSNQRKRKQPYEEIYQPETTICSVVAADCTNFSYISESKRLFKVLMSVATHSEVFVVIMFDRAARVLFGCSADEFFDFVKTHPFADIAASRALEGEMLEVTLASSKNGNAQHLRVTTVVPVQPRFRPIIETLRAMYLGGGKLMIE